MRPVLLLSALPGAAWALRWGNATAPPPVPWVGQGVEIRTDARGHETVVPNLELRSGRCNGTVWWLHPPKTGTSFAVSAGRCEQTEGRTEANHQDLPVVATDGLLRTVVGMFRNPSARMLSAYNWICKVPTCCQDDWGWKPPVYIKVKRDIVRGVPAGKALKPYQGCYTNMIIGRAGCMSGHKPTRIEMGEAMRRVALFRFVGLMEQWRLSVCLFNFLTEGRRFVTMAQLHNNRPTDGASKTTYDTDSMPADPFDGQIWSAVQQRFWTDVAKHGISERTCPMEQDGESKKVFVENLSSDGVLATTRTS